MKSSLAHFHMHVLLLKILIVDMYLYFFKEYLSGISQVLYTAEETLKTDEEANKVNIYVVLISLESAGETCGVG